MEETMGVLWFLQIVLGPLILGLALLYGTFQWRRRRRLQGEGNYTTREVAMIALPRRDRGRDLHRPHDDPGKPVGVAGPAAFASGLR
jgi:hypothetical protein